MSASRAHRFIVLGQCHFALGDPTSALDSLESALVIDPGNETAKDLTDKVVQQKSNISVFQSARARNHWRVAETACESCISMVEDVHGEIPVEWMSWHVEVNIARGRWNEAIRLLEYVRSQHFSAPRMTRIILTHIRAYCSWCMPFSTYMAKHTDVFQLVHLKAKALFLTGNMMEAHHFAAAALELSADDDMAKSIHKRIKRASRLVDVGTDAFDSGQWSQAIEDWTWALEVRCIPTFDDDFIL